MLGASYPRGRSGGNTPSPLFLLMQSAREPASLCEEGRTAVPPPRVAAAATRRSSAARDPAGTDVGTLRVDAPLSSSHPHGRRGHEGNCLCVWLLFYRKRVCGWSLPCLQGSVGRKGTDGVQRRGPCWDISFVHRGWTRPGRLFRLLFGRRSQDVPPVQLLAAASLPVTKFAKEEEAFLTVLRCAGGGGFAEKRPGAVPGCRPRFSAGGT